MPTNVTATGRLPVTSKYTPVPIANYPRPVSPAVIAIKQDWADAWQFDQTFEFEKCIATTGGHSAGSCEFRRHYGAQCMSPHQDDFEARTPLELTSWWVKVVLIHDQADELIWIGRITTERREIYSSATTQSGVQHWVAYEAADMLRKTHVHQSYWLVEVSSGDVPAVESRAMGWIPAMNTRDASQTLVGNRSDQKQDNCYQYGGSDLWTRYDYLEYIVRKFIDQSASGGPRWELGGQAYLLKRMQDTLTFEVTQTALEIIERLIDRRFGVDFVIRPIQATPTPGFEIHVFALSSTESSFAGFTLPRNMNRFSIDVASEPYVTRTEVVSTLDQQYDRINVVGARMVVAFSLFAEQYESGTAVSKWSDALEALYKAGTGNSSDEPEKHDKARESSFFDPVYAWFGAPVDWDMNGGDAIGPHINDDGELIWSADTLPDYQSVVRRTMTELPLREGFDYSVDPPIDHNPLDVYPNLQRPRAWFYSLQDDKWKEAQFGIASVRALDDDWGLSIEASPNHRIALSYFDLDVDKSAFDPNGEGVDQYERFNCESAMAMTLAYETDQRLRLRHEITSGAEQIGNEITISVPDAELWVLSKGTVVGVDVSNGELITVDEPRVLRNDLDRLKMVMAGAISRYKLARARAEITYQGLWPHTGLLGQVLDVIEQAGDTEYIDAPVTSVEWISGDQPITVIRAGFAR